jgi:hypothetical protein
MLRKAVLFVLLLYFLPQVFALCSRDVYYAAPGKNLDVITLISFDLDAKAKGVQSSIRAAPGQHITGTLAWKFGALAEGEARVNLFGNWSKAEIARLYSGSAIPNQSTSVEFSFFAPLQPGSYTLTAVFAFDTSFAIDSEASNLCSAQRCSSLGRCAVVYALASIEVLNTTPALYVEITSPRAEEIFSIGEGVTINGTVMPANASVALYINGTLAGEALPYEWNTSGLPPGEYPILVNASFANRSTSALVKVTLVNHSLAKPEHYEILPPRRPEQVYATSQSVIAVAGNEVYILKHSGDMLGSVKTGARPLISASGEHFVLAEKNLISFYRGTERVWNTSIDTNAELVAASPRGVGVVAGNNLYLFNTAGALLWTKQLEFKAAMLEMSNDSIGIVGNRTVYLLSYDGVVTWNKSFEREVVALALEGDNLFTLLGGEIHAFGKGEPLWNLTLLQNATLLSAAMGYLVAASPEAVELYDAQRGELIWRYYPEKGVSSATLTPDGSRIFILSGEKILGIPLAEEKRLSSLRIVVVAVALVIAGLLFFFLFKKRLAKPATEAQKYERREETLPLEVMVKSSKGGLPVEGALVKLNKLEETTNRDGIATFRIKPGTLSLSVEKEGFKPASKKFSFKKSGEGVEVELEPALSLPWEEEKRLEELRRRLDEAYERVAEHDPCLPDYFRSIGYAIIDGTEALSLASEFRESPAHVSALISAAERAVPLLCEAMQDWKNVALYQASANHSSEGCRAPEFPFATAVDFLLGKLTKEELEKEIFEVDRTITSMIGEVSTYPLASLWQISSKLYEKGKRSTSPEANASFALSHYLLMCIKHMLTSEDVLSRLRRSII